MEVVKQPGQSVFGNACKATQGNRIPAPPGRDPRSSRVCYCPGTQRWEAAGPKEELAESVRRQAGGARANRDLQNATDNFL